jgi:hypothetical protein
MKSFRQVLGIDISGCHSEVGATGAASSLLREPRRWKSTPHPSIEGRGSWASLTGVVEEGKGEGGVQRWWRRRREQTKINRDAVDVRFKLRSFP